MKAHFILYVADQGRSTAFYSAVFSEDPVLNVPGMTEFSIGPDTVLGLMPEAAAARLLGRQLKDNDPDDLTPRAEVYLVVEDAAAYHRRALAAGSVQISGLEKRDWGHLVAYSLDPDGHVLAFAEML